MSAFRTQPAAEESRVLFVGENPSLLSGVTQLFSEHEVSVSPLSYSEFLHLDSSSFESATIYKIVWWVDFSDFPTQKKVAENMRLSRVKHIVVTGILPEKFLMEGEKIPIEITAQQQFLSILSTQLPEAQFFFTRDFLDGKTLSPPLAFSLRGHQQDVLLDPELPWYFSTTEGFLNVISSSLIRPHTPKKAIIQGKAVMSSTWLKKMASLFESYYRLAYEVTPVIGYRLSPPLEGFIEVGFPAPTADLLDEFVRNKNMWLPAMGSLEIPSADALRRSPANQKPIEEKQLVSASQPASISSQNRRVIEGKRLINRKKIDVVSQQEDKIEGELARIFHQKRDEKKEKRIDNKVKIVKKIAKKSQKNKTLFVGGVAAMVLGGIILSLWGIFFVSTLFVRQEVSAFFSSHAPETTPEYQEGAWSRFLHGQIAVYERFLDDEWLGEGKELIQLEEAFQELQLQQKRLSLLSANYLLGILGRGDSSAVFPQEIKEQQARFQETIHTLTQSANRFFRTGSGSAEAWINALITRQQDQVLLSQLPEIIPGIVGEDGKKTYAVLLQNDLELRPTGGFIQAVAFLVFDRGLLIDTQVLTTAELDQRILAAVQAPAEIRQYLGEDQWRLRDSNWDPDFPSTAQRSAWFLREATGIQVDGVWAINYRFLQETLGAVGPLEIPEYTETLTDKNLLERVEFHSGDETAPQEVRNYAALILTHFLRRMQTISLAQAEKLLTVFKENLEQKQIMASFFDADQEETMSRIGWNGRIIDPACPQEFSETTCIVDQIFQVETNIGQNRVGSYITRQIAHRVDLSGERAIHTRIVTLKNTSRSDTWPLGTYRTYLRFIMDNEMELTRLTINGRPLAEGEVMAYGEGGRRVVGVALDIPQQSSATIELSYTTESLPQGPFSFLLFDQKQPGVAMIPTTITLYNPHRRAALIAPSGEIASDTVEFRLTHDDHLFTGVNFQ